MLYIVYVYKNQKRALVMRALSGYRNFRYGTPIYLVPFFLILNLIIWIIITYLMIA